MTRPLAGCQGGDRDRRVRELADQARRELYRAALDGDPRARRALRAIGLPAPAPRHWSDTDDEETG